MQTTWWSPFPPPPVDRLIAKTVPHRRLYRDELAASLEFRIYSRHLSFLDIANLIVRLAPFGHVSKPDYRLSPWRSPLGRSRRPLEAELPRRLRAATGRVDAGGSYTL